MNTVTLSDDDNISVKFLSGVNVVVIKDEVSGLVPVCIEDVPELIEILQNIVKENVK